MIEISNFSYGSHVVIFSSTLNANRLGNRRSARRASGISIIVSRKEQLLATGEVVFFFLIESSTPENLQEHLYLTPWHSPKELTEKHDTT